MAELGLIGAPSAAKAKATGFNTKLGQSELNGCQGTDYPFICDYVYRSLLATPSLGNDHRGAAERDQAWWPDDPDRDRSGDPGGQK